MSVRFKTILLPTDFSEAGAVALEYARYLADLLDAQLHALHVVDDAYQYWTALGPESLPLGPPPEEMLELARKRMDRFVTEKLSGLKSPPISNVAYGRPYAEIIAYARQHNVDLIVMGTHGHGAIAHVLLGSTTEKVVRKAHCAVLTIRSCPQPAGPN